jgi:circadian clock protein KaiB
MTIKRMIKTDNVPAKAHVAKVNGKGSPPAKTNGAGKMQLRLYVAGQTPKSLAALTNLRTTCEQHLRGKYNIKVIDLSKNPQLARGDQILALPTVVRSLPVPIRRMIGDLSDQAKLLIGLDLRQL